MPRSASISSSAARLPRHWPMTRQRRLLVGRYRVPQPRNALAKAVRDHAGAAMDVSDGLAGDLAKLCAASGVSAAIDAPSMPLSAPAARVLARGAVGIEAIVAGGDDYEILCAVPDNRFEAFTAGSAAGRGSGDRRSVRSIAGPSIPKFLDAQGREIALQRLLLQPFLGSFRIRGKTAGFARKYLPKIDAFKASAALRRGCDFGMVPPI